MDIVAAGGSDKNVFVQSHGAVWTEPVAVADALVFNAQASPVAFIVTGAVSPSPLNRANVNGSRRVVEKTPHRCVLVVVIEDHASSTIGAAESIVARARSFSIMIIHSQNNTCTDPRENP